LFRHPIHPHRRRTSTSLGYDPGSGTTPRAIPRRFHTRKLHSALSRQIIPRSSDKSHRLPTASRYATRAFVHAATGAALTTPLSNHCQCTGLWHFLHFISGTGHRGQYHCFRHPQIPLAAIFIPPRNQAHNTQGDSVPATSPVAMSICR
jgi:hypothetical protein